MKTFNTFMMRAWFGAVAYTLSRSPGEVLTSRQLFDQMWKRYCGENS